MIEMTASRLVIRTMLKHLVAEDSTTVKAALDAFSLSIDALTSGAPSDGQAETHAVIVSAVRRRAACMIDDLRQILVISDAH